MSEYRCAFVIYDSAYPIVVRVRAFSAPAARRIATTYAEAAFAGRFNEYAGVTVRWRGEAAA